MAPISPPRPRRHEGNQTRRNATSAKTRWKGWSATLLNTAVDRGHPFLTAWVILRSNCKYLIGHRQARKLIKPERLPALRRARFAVAGGLISAQQIVARRTRAVNIRFDRSAPAIVVKRDKTSMPNGATEEWVHRLRHPEHTHRPRTHEESGRGGKSNTMTRRARRHEAHTLT